jgi:hypothetical protein
MIHVTVKSTHYYNSLSFAAGLPGTWLAGAAAPHKPSIMATTGVGTLEVDELSRCAQSRAKCKTGCFCFAEHNFVVARKAFIALRTHKLRTSWGCWPVQLAARLASFATSTSGEQRLLVASQLARSCRPKGHA